jgi:protein TonB
MKYILIFLGFIFCVNGLHAQQNEKKPKIELDTIYNIVDVIPSYPGGEEAWKKYLKKNVKYPRKAWWEELEADVGLEFTIKKDGSITDIVHLTVVGWGFEEEAIRLLKKSGKWIPALKNGKPVNYHAKLTIPFRLK